MRMKRRRSRRGTTSPVWLVLILVLVGVVWATAMTAFNFGFMQGAGTAAVMLVIYSVPAALFDWPRITLADAFDILAAIAGAIVDSIRSLFDW